MPETKKAFLIQEAKQQAEALQRIGTWRRLALSLMAIGGLLAYTGFVQDPNILRGVLGIGIAVVFGGAALLLSIGKKNGTRNVKNILKVAEEIS